MRTIEALRQGRDAYDARTWSAAVEALTAADGEGPLGADDLERLATALFMVGREEDYFATLERAHAHHVDDGETLRAVRAAFWTGMMLFMRGQVGRGEGWLGRAQRLLEEDGTDSVERGYMLLPRMFMTLEAGDPEGAIATGAAAAEVARRFGDRDLLVLATHAQGQFLIEAGRVRDGLGLLDEAMLTVRAGEVSPIPTGIVYCGAIDGCRTAFDPRRAEEWTAALSSWCELQPEMLAFSGDCHLHRCEISELHGEWADALAELDWAAQRARRAGNARVAAEAAYRRGEILRRRGELVVAEEAYREAARGGREPQPGLALLRLAAGDTGAAAAAIRRVLAESSVRSDRASLVAAAVEIGIAADDLDCAREASAELEAIAAERPSDLLAATAAQMRGAVELAGGDAGAALPCLRRALAGWQDLGAPYEAARVRLLIADACRQLGDEDSAALELDTAHDAFSALGVSSQGSRDSHGLTKRELQVLRLVATGQTNRAIADELVLSERTVDRHVSNIFAKLRVASRAAATAYAYRHKLL